MQCAAVTTTFPVWVCTTLPEQLCGIGATCASPSTLGTNTAPIRGLAVTGVALGAADAALGMSVMARPRIAPTATYVARIRTSSVSRRELSCRIGTPARDGSVFHDLRFRAFGYRI